MNSSPDIKVQNIDHLGLISGIIKRIRFRERVDYLLPKTGANSKISHADSIIAMIISGLDFSDRRMYLMQKYFEDRPNTKLFGPNVDSTMFTDDCLGRTLDAIFKYGPTNFFMDVAIKILSEQNLLTKYLHLDSTSLSLKGKYKDKRQSKLAAKLIMGHSKDYRPDLKQLILALITTKDGIPLFSNTYSGNSSDREIFTDAVTSVDCYLKALDIPQDFVYIADSALYTKENLLNRNFNIKWITRITENFKRAKQLVEMPHDKVEWTKIDSRYKYREIKVVHNGIKQRWIVVHSKHAYHTEKMNFLNKIEKEGLYLQKRVNALNRKDFKSKDLVDDAISRLRRNHPYFKIFKKIKTIKKGRRKVFKLEAIFYERRDRIRKKLNTKGKFIVATNIMDGMNASEVVKAYKGHHPTIENCFRFIKDTSFNLKDVYLKRNDRIQALMAVMVLTLFINNIGQLILKTGLANNRDLVPNQSGKLIASPSLKWAFQLMRGINLVTAIVNDQVHRSVTNLKDAHIKIIRAIGPEASEIYGFT